MYVYPSFFLSTYIHVHISTYISNPLPVSPPSTGLGHHPSRIPTGLSASPAHRPLPLVTIAAYIGPLYTCIDVSRFPNIQSHIVSIWLPPPPFRDKPPSEPIHYPIGALQRRASRRPVIGIVHFSPVGHALPAGNRICLRGFTRPVPHSDRRFCVALSSTPCPLSAAVSPLLSPLALFLSPPYAPPQSFATLARACIGAYPSSLHIVIYHIRESQI